ncbi:radical SAM protein [Patescibacteria group bacterium]|nr:radical SAM protein [Patescibacteria group bacterium]MBU1016279.1 radical SAM protein [Patescibacteria group bacterium]MBU1685525.1 radical SAM protein [Patescibacteria group bacterium]MBU1938864.1 radical SAM protein [Patescibacteria group bacterium]
MDFSPVPKQNGPADLLLINPDFSKNELGMDSAPENHLGLNRIAGYLDKRGYTCSVIDTTGRKSGTSGPEELGDWLKSHAQQYQTIGFHTNSWNINHILRALERAKEAVKDKKLLFGGPLANSEPKKMLELLMQNGLERIGVVQGLGEKITDEILQKEKLTDVHGLWAFDNGHQKDGEKIALTQEEYEATPLLDLRYNTFYQQYYKPVMEAEDLGKYGMEIIFGSQGLDVNRGCPFNCTYCSVPQYEKKMITYSPKRVVDELEHLAKEAGFFMFTFTNSNIMFYDEDWITEFCQEIMGRGMNDYLNWTAYHHPITLARLPITIYHLMRKAGSDTIVFGVQSFEEKILKTFLRPFNTPELTKTIRAKSREAGQQLTVDYITGVSGEDLDVIEEAFKYFIENDIECRNYQLKFYPNTKLPTMKLDLSNHELVPITGNLAPELNAYAVVSKMPNKRAAKLDGMIRKANAELLQKRPVRLGKYVITSPAQAKELYKTEIPNNPNIPDKVKIAMQLSLKEMLNPKKREEKLEDLNPMEMMKKVIMSGDEAPPMVKTMKEKLRNELGEEKFQELRDKYEQANLD